MKQKSVLLPTLQMSIPHLIPGFVPWIPPFPSVFVARPPTRSSTRRPDSRRGRGGRSSARSAPKIWSRAERRRIRSKTLKHLYFQRSSFSFLFVSKAIASNLEAMASTLLRLQMFFVNGLVQFFGVGHGHGLCGWIACGQNMYLYIYIYIVGPVAL